MPTRRAWPVEAEGEEDVELVKASRSGDFIEGGPPQDGGGPANGSVAVLGKAHRARGPLVQIDDAAERAQRQVGRPSGVANFRKPILEILQQTPNLAPRWVNVQARDLVR